MVAKFPKKLPTLKKSPKQMGKFPVEAADVGLRPRKRVIAPFQIYFYVNDHKSREFGLLKASDIYSKNIVQLCYTTLYYIYIPCNSYPPFSNNRSFYFFNESLKFLNCGCKFLMLYR